MIHIHVRNLGELEAMGFSVRPTSETDTPRSVWEFVQDALDRPGARSSRMIHGMDGSEYELVMTRVTPGKLNRAYRKPATDTGGIP